MTTTSFATGNGLTSKIWAKELIVEMEKYLYFKRFMGTGTNNIIQVKEDLTKKKGDRITYGLRMKLSGAGISSDSTLEGSEEAMTFYNDTVTVDQLRNAVRLDGLVTEQRVAFDLRSEAKEALGVWLAETLDAYIFRVMRGDTTLTHGETVVACESTAIVYGGDATSTSDIDSSDTIDLTLVDALKEKAILRSPKLRPVLINGKEYYVLVMHPRQVTDLRTNTSTGQWLDIQKAATQAKGYESGIFTGALGEYNGVVLHSHDNINTVTNWGAGGNVVGAQALFMGAQAGCFAWAKHPFWKEKLFDYDNQTGFATGAIFGLNRNIFNSLDYASFLVRTAAASHA